MSEKIKNLWINGRNWILKMAQYLPSNKGGLKLFLFFLRPNICLWTKKWLVFQISKHNIRLKRILQQQLMFNSVQCSCALVKTFFKYGTRQKVLIKQKQLTPTIAEILWVENVRAIVVCGFLMKWLKKNILKIWKKNRGSRLGVTCTANPAQFEWKWAKLAVLFSR